MWIDLRIVGRQEHGRGVVLAYDRRAVDTGANPGNLANDQRGPGYARVFGAGPDIGAYERQPVDVIFANGFDP